MTSVRGPSYARTPHLETRPRSIKITLDCDREPFLGDHLVRGVPLLPSVMALDAMVWAARDSATGPVEISDLHLGPPVLFGAGHERELEVQTGKQGDWVRCALRGRVLHYDCLVRGIDSRSSEAGALDWPAGEGEYPAAGGTPSLTAADIYPPYFHGPLLQVIARARVTEQAVFAQLAELAPPTLVCA